MAKSRKKSKSKTTQAVVTPKRGRGRPTKYRPEFCAIAERVCAKRGGTVADLAAIFDVPASVINKWLVDYADFAEAVNRGRELAVDRVERSLHRRAVGMSVVETKVFCHNGQIITHDVKKRYAPDTRAQQMILYNMRRGKFKERQQVEVVGDLGAALLAARKRSEGEDGADE